MFAYCTDVLRLSESAAYLRIAVARAVRSFPRLLDVLVAGRLPLRNVAMIAPHLTKDNCSFVLERATHASRRGIEELIAELAPKPDVPARIRKLPQKRPRPAASPTSTVLVNPTPPPRRRPEPLAPERYKVQFTASAGLRDKIEKLAALMRASVPDADLAEVIDAAVSEKLERLEARRAAKTGQPRKSLANTDTSPSSRYVPAAVRRAVYQRDDERCAFVNEAGRRCNERHRLELHHVVPFARGGRHDPSNIRLLCRAHNVYRAECDFGRDLIEHYRRPASSARAPPPSHPSVS